MRKHIAAVVTGRLVSPSCLSRRLTHANIPSFRFKLALAPTLVNPTCPSPTHSMDSNPSVLMGPGHQGYQPCSAMNNSPDLGMPATGPYILATSEPCPFGPLFSYPIQKAHSNHPSLCSLPYANLPATSHNTSAILPPSLQISSWSPPASLTHTSTLSASSSLSNRAFIPSSC
ncbi:hypothetical protein VTK26DRAFT_5803 [Humicola hyalothermophila]